jgi:hypothetical protein
LAAFTVASIFYTWRAYIDTMQRRRQIRERVAYLVWVVANQAH